jgi:hypothetical protein
MLVTELMIASIVVQIATSPKSAGTRIRASTTVLMKLRPFVTARAPESQALPEIMRLTVLVNESPSGDRSGVCGFHGGRLGQHFGYPRHRCIPCIDENVRGSLIGYSSQMQHQLLNGASHFSYAQFEPNT